MKPPRLLTDAAKRSLQNPDRFMRNVFRTAALTSALAIAAPAIIVIHDAMTTATKTQTPQPTR